MGKEGEVENSRSNGKGIAHKFLPGAAAKLPPEFICFSQMPFFKEALIAATMSATGVSRSSVSIFIKSS